MIHWLVQALSDHPDMERGEPPPGLLSPAEAARLATLRVAKRRRDWILGRWTAKHLLQSALASETGVHVPFEVFSVENEASGAPLIACEADWFTANLGPAWVDGRLAAPAQLAEGGMRRLEPLSLSISHSGGQAFCALSLTPCERIGADIECIGARSPEFVADYFTDEERTHLAAAPAELCDTLITVTWSAKESALKALHLGLTVDTRRVTCLVDAPAEASDPVLLGYRWSRLPMRIEAELWHAAGLAIKGEEPPATAGWWQILSNYALTLVLLSPGGDCTQQVTWSAVAAA